MMDTLHTLPQGPSPATLFLLPMLGLGPKDVPLFRDCFGGLESHPEHDGHIIVATGTGWRNRESFYHDNQTLERRPGFVTSFDKGADDTTAYWVFRVPERWQTDYEHLLDNRLAEVSDAYIEQIQAVHPSVADKVGALFAAARQAAEVCDGL